MRRVALDADSRRRLASEAMIRARGSSRRKLSFTEEELEDLAAEFAEYAAEEIADLLHLQLAADVLHEIASEVAHAIHSALDELPQLQSLPGHQLRHAAMETVGNRLMLRPGARLPIQAGETTECMKLVGADLKATFR